jgi:ribose transport system permease protein
VTAASLRIDRLARIEDEIPSFVLVGLVVMLLVAIGFVGPQPFSVEFVGSVAKQAAIVGVVALGQGLLMVAGGIDISVGANAAVAGILCALLMVGAPDIAPLAIPAALGCGLAIGMLNGGITVWGRANPFIVTLGAMAILQGLALTLSPGIIEGLPRWFTSLYDLNWGPFPIVAIGFVLVTAAFWLLTTRTQLGRDFYAVGGNRQAARAAGIDVSRVSLTAYALCGLCASIAGLLSVAQAQIGTPAIGGSLAFGSITSAALAGISLFGGRGYVAAAALGALVLSMLLAVLSLLGINPFLQQLAQGLVILAALAVYKPR